MNFIRKFARAKSIRIVMPVKALEAVFDECDRYNVDETGGRLIGTFTDVRNALTITVGGIIQPGPRARRSNTSFFQDGEYQESVFRQVERAHPQIEHLGNWHTHHVNGFSTLSGGDVQTYQRTVNHTQHNTSFFYSLLVTAKEGARSKDRYRVKHYVLRRGDPHVYEIDRRHVEMTDASLLWPVAATTASQEAPAEAPTTMTTNVQATSSAPSQRAYDAAVLRDFFGQLRAFTSPKVELYWRGPIELSDGSNTQVIVVEDASTRDASYSVGLPEPGERLKSVAASLAERRFSSAGAALIHTERACNRALFETATHMRGSAS